VGGLGVMVFSLLKSMPIVTPKRRHLNCRHVAGSDNLTSAMALGAVAGGLGIVDAV
jgi:hypothetical protein